MNNSARRRFVRTTARRTFIPGGEEVKVNKPSSTKNEVKRLNIHVDVRLHNAFKAATAAQGKEMTEVLLKFIEEYVQKYLPTVAPKKGDRL